MKMNYAAICAELEKIACPKHQQHATVTHDGNGFEYTNVCCDEFKEILINKGADLFDDDGLSKISI